jgi:hypothetical protein
VAKRVGIRRYRMSLKIYFEDKEGQRFPSPTKKVKNNKDMFIVLTKIEKV